jgi:hypothetical protein
MQPIWIISENPTDVFDRLNRLFPYLRLRLFPWEGLDTHSNGILHENLVISFTTKDTAPESFQRFRVKVQLFLESGGCLIGLDDPFDLFKETFPEAFRDRRPINIDKSTLISTDPLLANWAGKSLVENLPGQSALLFPKQRNMKSIICFLEQDEMLAAFSFPFENGFVIFWGLPPGLFTEEQKDELLTYLINNSQTHLLQTNAQEKKRLERAEIVDQHMLMMNSTTLMKPITFSLSPELNAMVMLDWEGNAGFHLHIEDGQHHMALDHSSDRTPMVWGASLPGGVWLCQVSLSSSESEVIPALLTILSTPPLLRRKSPQKPPSSHSQVRRCRHCHMPLHPSMLYCPACGKKVENEP